MTKDKKLPKEYAGIVSLAIFFVLIILVGLIRLLFEVTNKRIDVDLDSLSSRIDDRSIDLDKYNLSISNAIKKRYGIDVYYGNVFAKSVNAKEIQNSESVFHMLVNINNALEKYPETYFYEIEEKGYLISINLVDYFENSMEALANRNSIGQFKIYISNCENIERAIHHEIYHILDYYIKLEKDEKMYSTWSNFNPTGFRYLLDVQAITGKYVYFGSSGAYFVTPYAKYSEKEDRAETFAESIMADRTEVFFNEGEPIKGKIDIIRKILRNSFNSINEEYHLAWE